MSSIPPPIHGVSERGIERPTITSITCSLTRRGADFLIMRAGVGRPTYRSIRQVYTRYCAPACIRVYSRQSSTEEEEEEEKEEEYVRSRMYNIFSRNGRRRRRRGRPHIVIAPSVVGAVCRSCIVYIHTHRAPYPNKKEFSVVLCFRLLIKWAATLRWPGISSRHQPQSN